MSTRRVLNVSLFDDRRETICINIPIGDLVLVFYPVNVFWYLVIGNCMDLLIIMLLLLFG